MDEQPEEILEPEDCIAKAIYLLQLCQMDLNFNRTETIWARAKAARKLCAQLEDGYDPRHKQTLAKVMEGLGIATEGAFDGDKDPDQIAHEIRYGEDDKI